MAQAKLLDAFAQVDDLLALGKEIPSNIECPIDLKPFQRQIDRITGKTIEGRSRVRVEWMMDYRTESYTFCGEKAWKHPYWMYIDSNSTVDKGTGLEIVSMSKRWIGIPRFIITELHSKEQAGEGWEKARYDWVDGVYMDTLGPMPEEGWYGDLFIVAKHDEQCCNGKGVDQGKVCYGGFKLPGEDELYRLKRLKYLRDHAETFTEPLEIRIAKEKAARDEAMREHFTEAIESALAPHAWRAFAADNTQAKYHFPFNGNKPILTDNDTPTPVSDTVG